MRQSNGFERIKARMNEYLDNVSEEQLRIDLGKVGYKKPIVEGIMNREHLMSRWDAWRKYIAEGGKGSWPRDEFEMLLDYFMEPNTKNRCSLCHGTGEIIPSLDVEEYYKDCKDCPHGGE